MRKEAGLEDLLASRPVFDAHVDSLQRQLDLGHDLGTRTTGHLDLVRGRQGGLGAAVFVCWADARYVDPSTGGARKRSADLLRELRVLADRHPSAVRIAGNGPELEAARAAGAVAAIPGIEGGHSIEESLDHLKAFFEDGVRVLTLVWNNHLSWIRSCQDGAGASVPEGLSDFGRSVVRAMNELGLVVDLSHAGERSFYDALEATSAPAMASHSGCKALHAHRRNLTDDQLRALAANGGVVGIVFCPAFLSAEAQQEDARVRAGEAYRALRGRNDTELSLLQGELLQHEARAFPIDCLIDHVVHAAEVAGVDHVGLGSDYDGIGRTPQGLEDASGYGRIAERLLARGFRVDDVEKVLGGNLRRVFARATAVPSLAGRALLAR